MSPLQGNKVDTLSTRNQNMRGRRTINAAPSVDSTDYVIQKELTSGLSQLDIKLQTNIDNLLPTIAYGSMWVDDTTIITNNSSIAIGVEIAVSIGLDAGLLRAMAYVDSMLVVSVAGIYLITWSMTMSATNNNELIGGGVMINTVAIHATEGASNVAISSRPNCVAGTGFVNLIPGDQIKLFTENDTAAHNITVTHANLTALKIA